MGATFTKDSISAALFAASGGKMKIIYDDLGNPCHMVRIPKFNLEDISEDLGTGPHPAFVVNGVEKPEIWIGAYQAIVVDDRAYSLPGQDPKTSITFDNARAACVSKGPGWHMMTAWEWAAVALWCLKNSFQPRGNTYYGKSVSAPWEVGVRVDGGTPGATTGTPRILTGSGPNSWRHDNTYAGISDLVGNVWEWNDGFKIIDGKMYFPNDNNFSLDEASWPSREVYFDATVGPGDRSGAVDSGDPVLSNVAPTHFTETPTPAGGTDLGDFDYAYISGEAGWRSMTYAGTYDSMELALRQKLAALMIAPKVSAIGSLVFGTSGYEAKGAIWVRNYGERFPLRGGDWGDGAYAGLADLNLDYRRAASGGSRGFRPAFIL